MLKLIEANPFRTLGVYSNASLKEITANKTKLAAYSKVGKAITFPSDLQQLLGAISRTGDSILNAEHELTLPINKAKYALFWFINATPIDKMALDYLQNGDVNKAMELFGKKATYSALINLSVLHLINNNLGTAIGCVSFFVKDSDAVNAFIMAIGGNTMPISASDLWKMYMDVLLTNWKPKAILDAVQACAGDTTYIKDKVLSEYMQKIRSEIAVAKKVNSQDAIASFAAGKNLISKTRIPFAALKRLMSANLQYQVIADELAEQILQCGINYFNNSNDSDDVDKALELQEYALNIAVSKLVKDRCKKNVDILNKRKEQEKIGADVEYVANELRRFKDKYATISAASELVSNCRPHLQVIANNLGKDNELYLQISTAVANNALGMLVSVINREQNSASQNISALESLKDSVDRAMSVMLTIGTLDMSSAERARLATNKQTLSEMRDQISAAVNKINSLKRQLENYSSQASSSSSSSGCYIATMVYGDYDHPQVLVLRDFRDQILQKHRLGRAFIRFYYRYSPTWVEHMKDKKRINKIIRSLLDKFIKIYNNEKN